MVRASLPEPAVIHHKQLGARLRRLLCKHHLALAGHVEGGSFPGIIEHAQRPVRGRRRHHALLCETVQDVGHFSQARVAVARIYPGRGKGFSAFQIPEEIRVADPDLDVQVVVRRLLRHHLEIAGPGKRPEPDLSLRLIRVLMDDKRRGSHMGCGPSQALIYLFPRAQGIFAALEFIRPGAVVVDAPVSASRQRIFSGEEPLDLNRLRPRIFYFPPLFQNVFFLMHRIMKRYLQRIIHVFQHEIQPVSLRPVLLHAIAEIPYSV